MPPFRRCSLLLVLAAISSAPSPASARTDDGGWFSRPAVADDGTVYVSTRGSVSTHAGAVWAFRQACIGGTNDGVACQQDTECPQLPGTCLGQLCEGGGNDDGFCTSNLDCPAAEEECGAYLDWVFQVESEIYSSPGIAPAGAPGAGTIYVGADDRHLYALAKDPPPSCIGPGRTLLAGCELWKEPTHAQVRAAPVVHPDNGRIFVSTEADGRLYAFFPDERCESDATVTCNGESDCATGACSHRHWDLPVTAHMHFNPVLDEDSGTIYVGGDKGLYAVSPKAVGAEPSACGTLPGPCIQWSFQATGVGSQAFLSGGRLDPAAGVLYATGTRSLVALDVSGGVVPPTLLWEYDTEGTRERQSPALSDAGDFVYLSVRDGRAVHAIPTATCEPSPWRYPVNLNLPFSTALASKTNDWVYVGGEDKCVYALDPAAGSNATRRMWDFKAKGAFQSEPALSEDGKTLYIGNQKNYFFALDTEAVCDDCDWDDNVARVKWCFNTKGPRRGLERSCAKELGRRPAVPKVNKCCDPARDAKRCAEPEAGMCVP